jgi:hypothetical protein
MNEDTPQLKKIPPSTSKFVLAVFKEVFQALAVYNIKFKAEFNYLGHPSSLPQVLRPAIRLSRRVAPSTISLFLYLNLFLPPL